jgi:flavin reductase (DIM6/NTAB) family NADH-FMN oxidoreductase RutF
MNEEKEITWDAFVQSTVVNFFNEQKIEKLSIDDGNGNKAKLTRLKDCGIKIESSSTTTL